ncbi:MULTISPECIES: RodZ family helix-turn-helix domain-containing protein [unclassified Pusillimonas]|uniref:helix-turn-helix domain-containing protein n=1 Tax=unclassified Pusillimonas TaxID=2640016 RepID=UPI000B9D0AB7|nr:MULTISPECIES: helix-turn-helix domain-containing protein [unclassified Pusillimonas]OXR48489.1 hypothetical protein PuT2_12420 [Pusillimonas sp. T2]ROT46250.1 hypothetical protein CHR62_04620 [Pusillimonas sp. NJUB218]
MNQPLLKEEAQSGSVVNLRDGVGATLKTLRQARRVTLSEASARLKFSTRQLQALEAEQWADLPVGLPLRGMVKNYARFLEADVDAIMVMLGNQTGNAAVPKAGIAPIEGGAAFTPSDLPVQHESRGFSWVWFVVILLVLAAAGFYAVDRGWVPEAWLTLEWFRSAQS